MECNGVGHPLPCAFDARDEPVRSVGADWDTPTSQKLVCPPVALNLAPADSLSLSLGSACRKQQEFIPEGSAA